MRELCAVFAVIVCAVRVWNPTSVFTWRTCQDVAVCLRIFLWHRGLSHLER